MQGSWNVPKQLVTGRSCAQFRQTSDHSRPVGAALRLGNRHCTPYSRREASARRRHLTLLPRQCPRHSKIAKRRSERCTQHTTALVLQHVVESFVVHVVTTLPLQVSGCAHSLAGYGLDGGSASAVLSVRAVLLSSEQNYIMAQGSKVPITMLSGFLGAGVPASADVMY